LASVAGKIAVTIRGWFGPTFYQQDICDSNNKPTFLKYVIIIIIISIFVKRHKVVTSEALAAVGCVC